MPKEAVVQTLFSIFFYFLFVCFFNHEAIFLPEKEYNEAFEVTVLSVHMRLGVPHIRIFESLDSYLRRLARPVRHWRSPQRFFFFNFVNHQLQHGGRTRVGSNFSITLGSRNVVCLLVVGKLRTYVWEIFLSIKQYDGFHWSDFREICIWDFC